MTRRLAVIIAAVVVLGAISAGIAIAAAGGGGDDTQLTGATLERATDAALRHTSGGAVVETEAGDDGAAYGVEIRRANGTVVEVNLDEDFNVIGQEVDEDTAGEEDDDDD